MRELLPPLAGRRTFGHAFASLLLFELTALCGEWLLHQIEYQIVYGARFQSVMGHTPHRYYMEPAGSALALTALLVVSSCLLVLYGRHCRVGRFRSLIPSRVHGLIPDGGPGLTFGPVARTALALAASQVAVYLVQENLEACAAGLASPGFSVLLAPTRLTVIPLDVLIAVCGSVLLWTFSLWGRRSQARLAAAAHLAALFAGSRSAERSIRPQRRSPHRRLLRTARGLRSPPLTA
jgi:hypothetical protein